MSWLSKLTIAQRFGVVVVLCALGMALPSFKVTLHEWQDLRDTQLRREGLAPAQAMLAAIRLMQQHRGMTAMWLSGNEQAASQRAAKAGEVDKALAAVDALLKEHGAAKAQVGLGFAKSREAWKALSVEVAARQLDPPASFQRHTATISSLLFDLALAAEHWGLVYDPLPRDYHLTMGALLGAPQEAEIMGQMRARGAALLTAGGTGEPSARARFAQMADALAQQHRQSLHSMQQSQAQWDQAPPALAQAVKDLGDLGQRAAAFADQHVVKPDRLTFSSKEYFDEMTRAIDGVYQAQAKLVGVLGQSLAQRETGHGVRLTVVALATLALFAAALGVVVHTGLWLHRSLGAEPDVLNASAGRVAEGELAHALPVRPGDTTSVMAAMSRMQRSLAQVVSGVRDNASQVATASGQIAQGNQDLSSRTESQASALQETAASMEQLRTTIGHSAESAREASQLASQASEVAGRGGQVVGELAGTMKRIQESSHRIADIIGTIDSIAFQTNILALNAAVEAARAGEQGRGFAVVASEVRALAQRSAEAAREIRTLIADSVERVAEGGRQGAEAASTSQEVVQAIRRVSDLIGEVSSAAQEQNGGVQQVSEAVSLMDQSTQQNAALVEESAAASESLRQQAEALLRSVSAFRTAHA